MAPRNETPLQYAEGISPMHSGEILQGSFRDADALYPERALITLPCPKFQVIAKFTPSSDSCIRIIPEGRVKSATAVANVLRLKGRVGGGQITLETNLPQGMIGAGMGSSTADVTASVIAIYRAQGIEPT